MAKIHLIEGPVGSGKSTFSLKLQKEIAAIHFPLDDWMASLFKPDRPNTEVMEWYLERKQRCIQHIWKVAQQALKSNTDVILELGLITKQARQEFLQAIDSERYSLTIYVLEADRNVRRDRVKHRNMMQGETYSMHVPDDIFEIASNMWEPITDNEFMGIDIQYVSTNN